MREIQLRFSLFPSKLDSHKFFAEISIMKWIFRYMLGCKFLNLCLEVNSGLRNACRKKDSKAYKVTFQFFMDVATSSDLRLKMSISS